MYEVFVHNFSAEGTFNALTARLDELKDLGINTLWLMPIQPTGQLNKKGTYGSPYSISDYTAVNPNYGTKKDFQRLVDSVHAKGMYIIIVEVANHTSWDHAWVKEHPEWYMKDSTGKMIPPVADWTDVADLNFDNQELRQELIKTMKYWIDSFNIDGYRCDVAGMVPIALAAYPVSLFYDEPRLIPTLLGLAFNLLLVTRLSVTLALLRRDLRFDRLVAVIFFMNLAQNVGVMLFAWWGAGYMSMVYSALLSNVVGLALVLRRKDALRMRMDRSVVRELMSFGVLSSSTNILRDVRSYLNEIVLAKTQGMATVAYQSKALSVMSLFWRSVMPGVYSSSFSYFAQNTCGGDLRAMRDFRQGAVNDSCPFTDDPRKAPFHLAWFEAAPEQCHVTALFLGDALIASVFLIKSKRTAHIGIVTYAPEVAAHSPSKLLLYMAARALAAEGCNQLAMTPGGDAWKERFGTHHETAFELIAYPTRAEAIRIKLQAGMRRGLSAVANALSISPEHREGDQERATPLNLFLDTRTATYRAYPYSSGRPWERETSTAGSLDHSQSARRIGRVGDAPGSSLTHQIYPIYLISIAFIKTEKETFGLVQILLGFVGTMEDRLNGLPKKTSQNFATKVPTAYVQLRKTKMAIFGSIPNIVIVFTTAQL